MKKIPIMLLTVSLLLTIITFLMLQYQERKLIEKQERIDFYSSETAKLNVSIKEKHKQTEQFIADNDDLIRECEVWKKQNQKIEEILKPYR